jgi:hypothetical protein
MTPYRTSAKPTRTAQVQTQFDYIALRRDATNHSLGFWLTYITIPTLVATMTAIWISETVGAIALVGMLAFGYFRRKSLATRARVVLRVEGGKLEVAGKGSNNMHHSIAFSELLDVELDTKTIQRVHEGTSPIPAVRFTDTRIGLDVDQSRLVLVLQRGERIPLSEQRVAHMDAVESFGKLRSFLRKNGWVPLAERSELAGSELAAAKTSSVGPTR